MAHDEPAQPTFQAPTLREMARSLPQYEMHGFIAQGGMGAVYLARQAALDRFVAIKVLPPTFGGEMDFAARFQTEARAMAKLQHGNIVSVYDFGVTKAGHIFLVMEYVDGHTLHDLIHTGAVTKEQALSFALQLCDALQFAHDQGIVHRDIKPNNILINKAGQVKVADFGLARPTAAQDQEVMMGTPDYAAPEITTGLPVDHRADIYAMGVAFYEMLTRTVPKKGKQPASALSGCDPGWDDVITKATRVLTKDRYQQVKEIRQALSLMANRRRQTPMSAPGPRATQRTPYEEAPAAPMLGMMVKGMLALMVGLTALYFWSKRQPTLDQMTADSPAPSTLPASGPPATPSTAPAETATTAPSSATMPAQPSVTVVQPRSVTPPAAASGKPLRSVDVANVPTGHLSKFQQAHSDVVMSVKILPDQKRAVTVSSDLSAKIWEIATGECLWTSEANLWPSAGIDITADGKRAVVGAQGGSIELWDLEARSVLNRMTAPGTDEGRLSVVRFSADERSVLFARSPTPMGPQIWHFADGGSVTAFGGWETRIYSIVPLLGVSDGAFVAGGGLTTRGSDGRMFLSKTELMLTRLAPEPTMAKFSEAKGFPNHLVISPDGTYLASTESGNLVVYHIATQTQVMRSTPAPIVYYSLQFLDGGRLLLAGGSDGTLRIYDVAGGVEVWRAAGETFCTNRVAISADQTWAISGGGYGGPEGARMSKDGDYALHLWRLPAASSFPSRGAIVVPVKATLDGLETADPELAKLRSQMESEWQEKVESLNSSAARGELDTKYVAALRSRLQSAVPSERDSYLTEISRVANKGLLPVVPDPKSPPALKQLMKIYIDQITLLEQKPKEVAAALLKVQAERLASLIDARTKAGDNVAALRGKLLQEAWTKAHPQ